MQISFFETHPWEKEELKKTFKSHKLFFSDDILTVKNVRKVKDTEILSVYICSKINKDILDQLPNLKLITTRSTGFDHISLEECRKRGIVVCNVPSYGENTVAEHAFALILELSRRVSQTRKEVLENKKPIAEMNCFDLKRKTIGVIGTGKIGQSSIHIAKGFGMNVLAYDIFKNEEAAKTMNYTYVDLPELLKKSDIITLHVLLTDQTRHLLNEKTFKYVKKGAIIINTSRGPVIDTRALVKALRSNKISGAGLDVMENEDNILEHNKLSPDQKYLLSHQDVFFTPHSAFYSKESVQRILFTTIENIQSFLINKAINLIK
ncbi:hydroxyacid dehydrogenase [Candidatus Pacearchaeota archaeon]|nr:hydroxyacid dehydrogenase [Candidatus Pacearchaeota archaeon]